MNYQEFLENKIVQAPVSGFDCGPDAVNKALKPHQRDAVRWLLLGGRRALFESFGLGKTAQQLEFCRLAAGLCPHQRTAQAGKAVAVAVENC